LFFIKNITENCFIQKTNGTVTYNIDAWDATFAARFSKVFVQPN